MQARTWICTYQMQTTKFMSLLPLLVCSSCPRILILVNIAPLDPYPCSHSHAHIKCKQPSSWACSPYLCAPLVQEYWSSSWSASKRMNMHISNANNQVHELAPPTCVLLLSIVQECWSSSILLPLDPCHVHACTLISLKSLSKHFISLSKFLPLCHQWP